MDEENIIKDTSAKVDLGGDNKLIEQIVKEI